MRIRKHKIQDAKNYYGNWIISPSGDFIMKQKITPSCPSLRIANRQLLRNELYTGGIAIYYRYEYNKLKEKFIINDHFTLIPLK